MLGRGMRAEHPFCPFPAQAGQGKPPQGGQKPHGAHFIVRAVRLFAFRGQMPAPFF